MAQCKIESAILEFVGVRHFTKLPLTSPNIQTIKIIQFNQELCALVRRLLLSVDMMCGYHHPLINNMQQHTQIKDFTLHIIDTITVDMVFRDPILFQYWRAGNLTDRLKNEFQSISVRLTEGQAVRIQSKSRPSDICHYLQQAYCNIHCIKVDLKLLDPDIEDVFLKSQLIANILQQYFQGYYIVNERITGAIKGNLLLYFNMAYTSYQLALKKSYELSGLTHQNLTFTTNDVPAFENMKLAEKISLLKTVVREYFGHLKEILQNIEDFKLQSIQVDKNGDLVLNVVGFRRSFISLFENIYSWLSNLVFTMISIGQQPYEGRNINLQRLVSEINEKDSAIQRLEGINITKYHIKDSYLILLGQIVMDSNLKMFIESRPRKVKFSQQQIDFLRTQRSAVIKQIKRNTDYFELTLHDDYLLILSNFQNYQKIRNSIDAFLKSNMLETCYHRFKSHQNLMIFMKYYPDLQKKLFNIRVCPDDKNKIQFQCNSTDKNFLTTRVEQCERNILADTVRLFVPHQIQSKQLTTTHYEHGCVYSPLCQQGFEIRNKQNARIHLIDEYRMLTTQIYSLILPFKANRQKIYFLSQLSEILMQQNGYLSIFMKLTHKDLKKNIGFTYCNDKNNNINEMQCCNIQLDVKILVDEMKNTIMNNLTQDGIGIVMPDDDIDTMKTLLNAFISVIEDYCAQQLKGRMLNYYVVCSNIDMLIDCQEYIVNDMKYGLKLLPAQLSMFSAYELKILPFNSLEVDKAVLQSNLLSFIVALEDICRPKNEGYPGLVVNLVKADDPHCDIVLINYDEKKVYDFKQNSSYGIRDYLRIKESVDIERYLRVNLEVSRLKKAGPKLHVMHLRNGALVGDFYRIKKHGFVKTVKQETAFIDEDTVIPYKLKKIKKLPCIVLSGYDREILSVVNGL